MSITCRRATPSDTAPIVAVHRAAFSSDVEADLVESLLTHPAARPAESWVAVVDDAVVGHVLLTGGDVPGHPLMSVLLLCPLGVAPAHQHAGVGHALTRAAIAAARDAGVRAITVFGDPDYYGRFGFTSLLPDGPLPPFDIAAQHHDAWQTLVLTDDPTTVSALHGARISWAEPLMQPGLWQG